MYELRQTTEFQEWLDRLSDRRAVARIAARVRMVEAGHLGDFKSVGQLVSEIRIDVGPGYRLYFTRRGKKSIVMLVGGDKSTQKRDIKRAQAIALQLEIGT